MGSANQKTSITQLAAEAANDVANHIRVHLSLTLPQEHIDAIRDHFQAAIEKALSGAETAAHLSYQRGRQDERESRAAHASEQRADLRQLLAECLYGMETRRLIDMHGSAQCRNEVIKEIISALSQRPTPATAGKEMESVQPRDCGEDTKRLLTLLEMIPVRSSFGGAGEAYGILTSIVSQAKNIRAAMKERTWFDHKWLDPKCVEHGCQSLQPHASKQGADTKRLVELLRGVHTWFMQQAPQHYNGCGLWIDIDAELAEHPRPTCLLDVDSPTLPPEKEEYYQCGCVTCRKAIAAMSRTTTEK